MSSFNHDQQLEAISTECNASSTTNPAEDALLQHVGRSSLNPHPRADQKENSMATAQNRSQIESVQTAVANLEQYTRNIHCSFIRLFHSSLQLYLSNEPHLPLSTDANHLLHTILETMHQSQQQQPSQVHVDAIARHRTNENLDSMPNQLQIENPHRNNSKNINHNHNINSRNEAYENSVSLGDDFELKRQDVVQDDEELNLNEFILEYNKNRPANRQINGDAVIRCFADNDMDYTDFRDLNHNLKRYGIPANAVRKLWKFLNPVEMNENDQDEEDVVRMPVGSYIHFPSEYEHLLLENDK